MTCAMKLALVLFVQLLSGSVAQTTNPTPVPMETTETVNPVCYICGSATAIATNQDDLVPIPQEFGQLPPLLNCKTLALAGIRRFIPADACLAAQQSREFQEICGCKETVQENSVPPSDAPSYLPTLVAPIRDSISPSSVPSDMPSHVPTILAPIHDSDMPSSVPSDMPSYVPTVVAPSDSPGSVPSSVLSDSPSDVASTVPSDNASSVPSSAPKKTAGDNAPENNDVSSSFGEMMSAATESKVKGKAFIMLLLVIINLAF